MRPESHSGRHSSPRLFLVGETLTSKQPAAVSGYPYVCDICQIPSVKRRHYRCVDLVARRLRRAMTREERALGRYVGKFVWARL